MPFLSVIVPVFGVEQYLPQCLDSVLAQTFTDFELILIEDGSPDGCAAICDEYAARDSRVSVLHKKNQGLVRARKDGLKLASGTFVGFVDGDDWAEPTMFQVLCEAAEASDADVVGCQFFVEYPDQQVVGGSVVAPGVYDKVQLERDVYPIMLTTRKFGEYGVVPAVWCKIFRREILAENLPAVPDRIRNGEDGAVTYPCLLDAEKICLLPDALYHYRQHASQMVRELDVRHVESLLLWADHVCSVAMRHENQAFLVQIAYYVQFKVTLLLDAAFGVSNAMTKTPDRWAILRAIGRDPIVRKMLAQRHLGPLPAQARVSFAMMDSPWWPLATVLYSLVGVARMAARQVLRKRFQTVGPPIAGL